MVGLRSLDLSYCRQLGALPAEIGKLRALETLKVRGCTRVRFPREIGQLAALTELDLSEAAIPKEIGSLASLATLNLEGCATVPHIGGLRALTSLNLSHGHFVALSPEIGRLASLRVLRLRRCERLSRLPKEIGNLAALTELDVCGCEKLAALPLEIGRLPLTSLDLSYCRPTFQREIFGELRRLASLDLASWDECPEAMIIGSPLTSLNLSEGRLKELPWEVCGLPLTSLNLRDCAELAFLPRNLSTSLTRLDLCGCRKLTAVEIGDLASLRSLDLGGCTHLAELGSIGGLVSLAFLNLEGCEHLTRLPPDLGRLPLLSLNLNNCKHLPALPAEIGHLTSLTSLNLESCEHLALPPAVGGLRALTELDLGGCWRLAKLPSDVGELTSLTTLSLRGCWRLAALPPEIENLVDLAALNLRGCKRLTKLDRVASLKSLTSLDLGGCGVTALPSELGTMTGLTSLNLQGCKKLESLPNKISGIENLNLGGCEKLKTLPPDAVIAATVLDLTDCDQFVSLPPLEMVTSLTLEGCEQLTALPTLGRRKLATLNLQNCKRLSSVAGVAHFEVLSTLNLRGCSGLTTLDEISTLTSLTRLDCEGCCRATSLPFERLPVLAFLGLRGCSRLLAKPPPPPPVSSSSSLTSLDLGGAETVPAEIVGRLSALTSLDLGGSEALEALPPEIGGLPLATLSLRGCARLATLPLEMGNLRSLTTLDLSGCEALVVPPRAVREAREVVAWLEDARLMLSGDSKARERVSPDAVARLGACVGVDAFASRVADAVKTDPALATLVLSSLSEKVCPACRRAARFGRLVCGRFDVEETIHASATSAVLAATDLEEDGARCALKAMRDPEQVVAELDGRIGDGVLGITAVFVDAHHADVTAAAKRLGLKKPILARGLAARLEHDAGRYEFLVAMDLGRTLAATPLPRKFETIREIGRDIAVAAQSLHAKGRVHADLAPNNVVRSGSAAAAAAKWKLIDMDVSCDVGKPLRKAPRSGYAPPEVAKVLMCASASGGGVLDDASRRISDYEASVACDLWGLGCILFSLVHATTLFHVDADDNVASRKILAMLACEPTDKPLRRHLAEALKRPGGVDKKATALLRKLLEPDPEKRRAHFEGSGLLEEPFFTGAEPVRRRRREPSFFTFEEEEEEEEDSVATTTQQVIRARTLRVEGLPPEIDRHARALRLAVEADSRRPAAFVILPHALGNTPNVSLVEQLVFDREEEEEEVKEANESAGVRFVRRTRAALSLYSDEKNATTTEAMHLFLVCEMCWLPQPRGLKITAAAVVRDLLPIAEATMAVVRAVNGVAGVALCFLPGVPRIPMSMVAEIGHATEQQQQRPRRSNWQAFARFLDEEDPLRVWADLSRLVHCGEDSSMWVCNGCADVLKHHNDKPYACLRRLCKPILVPDLETTTLRLNVHGARAKEASSCFT
ncbi:hypothetical protein CTAYLR_008795 [Chrysophaeum taylorii]|uniref:Protein kinase domain-containing protein n=1 Tax=Chrysophaeum taylorii TaxID=2483200 RepID=A0AAD7UNQ4_9STRA|nr:hypothetical protein CTAYLR_008795 [Chrysophaeum taylorii]